MACTNIIRAVAGVRGPSPPQQQNQTPQAIGGQVQPQRKSPTMDAGVQTGAPSSHLRSGNPCLLCLYMLIAFLSEWAPLFSAPVESSTHFD